MPSAIRIIDLASEIVTATGNFDGILSGSDSDVQTALETIDEIFKSDIVLDDGAGDSPRLKLVGGSNDDDAYLLLDDDAVAGQSNLKIKLPGDVSSSKLSITNDSGVLQVQFSAIGEAVFNQQGNDANYRIEAVGSANCFLLDAGNGNITINGFSLSAHYDLLLKGDGVLALKESATPTADANYGKIYCKNDNKLYFQTGAGVEEEIAFV